MILKGSFYIYSIQNNKYMWQYKYILNNDESFSLYNVIRPLFTHKSNIRFYDFTINNQNYNEIIQLQNGDSFNINKFYFYNNKLHITITWKLQKSVLWEQIKHTPLAQIFLELENKQNINHILKQYTEQDIDNTLDNALLFTNKISNYIQHLQENLNNPNDLLQFSPQNITKTISYISHQDL